MSRPYILVGCMMLAACQADAPGITDTIDIGAAFTEQSPVAPPDLVAERESLLAADRAFAEGAAATNVIEGSIAMFTEDVLYQAPSGLIQGRSAVREYLAGSSANAVASMTWVALRADVSRDGRQGYSYGYTTITLPGRPPFPGKYIAYWQRDDSGDWKVVAYKRVARPFGSVATEPPAGFESPSYHHYRAFPGSDPVAALEDVMRHDRAFAEVSRTRGGAAAFAGYVAGDGAVFGGFPEFLFGNDAVADYYEPLVPGQLVWSPSFGSAAATGDLAFTMGEFEWRDVLQDGSLSNPSIGWYFSVWKRQRDGEWKFVIDG